MVTAVLFDLDGTLVDHVSAGRAAVLAWTKTRSAPAARSDSDVTAEWLRLEQVHFAGYLARDTTFGEQRRRRLRDYLTFLGEDPPVGEVLDAMFEDYLRHYERAWSAYDDAGPTLSQLAERGLLLGVLTNGEEDQQRAKLHAVGLLDAVDHVIASSSLSAAKPAVAAFHEACRRVGRQPHEVLYIGDDLRTDALAATAAGLVGVWLDRFEGPAAALPAKTVRCLADVVRLVDGLRTGAAST